MKRAFVASMIVLTAVVLSASIQMPRSAGAQTTEDLVAAITSPTTGQQLFGLVNIQGSAMHPSAFESYTLEYSNQAETTVTWLLVQPRVSQQVDNGILGTWNTNVIPDGTYRLRLRVFLKDGQVGEYMVENLRVINSEPTPVPTTVPSNLGSDGQLATPGPTPTSPIVQPPSNNPSTGVVSGLDSSAGTSPDQMQREVPAQRPAPKTEINMDQVRSAFCSGVYLALGSFILGGIYTLFRRPKHTL